MGRLKFIKNFRYYFVIYCLSIFCLTNNASGQAVLSVTSGNVTTLSVSHCQNFECYFTIKNTGTATASYSIANIYISNNSGFTSPIWVSAASSVKSLIAGESTTLYFTFSVPLSLAPGTYYVGITLNGGSYHYLPSVPFTITPPINQSVKIPYPIIFIHGLNSNDLIWNDFTNDLNTYFGLQSGGRMNFCLNYDGNNITSTLASDYHDFYTLGSLGIGDYYTVNFAVDPTEHWDTAYSVLGIWNPSIYLSNQSAIVKQGRAVKDAIKHVLQITGRDKVILVCHSMGGLASREYLEDTSIWQSDGKHHVAKLFTIGTPHGGSNANFTGLGDLKGIDQHSEAMRDLHFSSSPFYAGVYLEGGNEVDILSTTGSYYNNDINCNGSLVDVIVGLNYKYLPPDISYACTIGTGSLLGGNGIVASNRADLNEFPNYPYLINLADTFNDPEFAVIQSHTDLPRNFEIDMKGIDEDNYYNSDYPYHINLNNSYYGFIQQQSKGSTDSLDYDNYTFKCTQKGTLHIKIENIIVPDFNLWLIDSGSSTGLLSFPIPSNQNGNIDVQIQLPIGKYILHTDAIPITNSEYYPYLIKTTFTNNWSVSNYTICAGSSQILTAPSGFSAYQWSLNGAIISGLTSQSISTGTAGYYSFKTTNSFGYIGPWSDSVLITVNPLPVAGTISGAATVCVSSQITLTHSGAAGTWSAANGNASVSASGVVTGISAGTDVISYTVINSCGSAVVVGTITVNPLPIAGTISGASAVCAGSQITLTHSGAAGTWSAANGNASVSAGGIVTGITAGTDIISYTVTNLGCSASVEKTITVNPLPIAGTISGASAVCVDTTITLTHSGAAGTWSAANGNASVSAGGVVTGITAGTDIISYTVVNLWCTASVEKTITVNPLPIAGTISGASAVCAGSQITLTHSGAAGTWSAANGNASVSGGVVTGITAGTDIISYTVTNSCGSAVAVSNITVNPMPVAGTISGSSAVCVDTTITLTHSGAAGTWSAANGNASVSTGVVTGITAGTDIISYTVVNLWCTASVEKTITVNPLPVAGTISGSSAVCAGSQITLTHSGAAGTWSAANGNASVSAGGVVTGITAGTDIISYTVTNSCGSAVAIRTITVNPLPVAGTISGATTVCVDTTITLTHSGAAGTWSAANGNASVSSGGVVTGITAGTDIISYRVVNLGCTAVATWNITVNPLPVAGTISGSSAVCVDTTITLTHSGAAGTWSAANGSASVSGGVVTGISAGSNIISYTVTNSCGSAVALWNITVNPLPIAGNISGASGVCVGSQITLDYSGASGTWIVANDNASISGGIVTGITAGTDIISYEVTNLCGTATVENNITVNPLPDTPMINQYFNLLSAPPGYSYYQWTLNGSVISGATSDSFTVVKTGVYAVIVTNSFSCSTSSQQTTISNITYGINDMKIYPNPSESVVFIQWYKKVKIKLTCMDGRLVKVLEDTDEIDLSNLPNGNYLISIFDENNTKLKTQIITKLTK